MSKKNDAGKPALFANYIPDEDTAELSGGALEDPSWIEGYSQIVQANDIAAANDLVWANQHEKTGITKEKVYNLIGARPRELPMQFKWLRVAGPDGGNSYSADADTLQHKERGYRIVTPADLTSWGLELPPSAHVAGGMIRRLDVALFVVDGRRERLFEERRAREAAERESQEVRRGQKSGVEIRAEAERGEFTLTTKE